jgi:ribonuclease-3
MTDQAQLEQHLGVSFRNRDLLTQALVHRSYLNENPEFHLAHNERLEYLGDAVLELVVTEHLYRNYPNPEGELTNWRAALVNARMLAELAQELHLDDFLYLSKGERRDANSKARLSILANAVEAVIGALYLDQGLEASRGLIDRLLLPKLPNILEHRLYMDPKSKLQEISQEKLGITPAYRVVSESGPDHAKQFTVAVTLNSESIAEGAGDSKQAAQVAAAEAALKTKGWE